LVVDHESEKTHHGGTSLVELDGTLLELGLFIEGVPSEVQGTVAEVTREFTLTGDILHDSQFKEADESKNLEGSGLGNGERGGPTVTKVRELGSRVVNVSGKVDSGLVDKVSDNTEHADASVLQFNISKTVELFLVSIGDEAKGIEESKRRLGSEFVYEKESKR
jgi:hypothetical protein